MEKGLFIVIEGVDGCGKTTQFELLYSNLKKVKPNTIIADFPRYYSSTWGKIIGELLRGRFGNFIGVTPYLTVFPYMVDQYTWSRDIGAPWLSRGGYILSNRYFTSNVHQVAKFKGRLRRVFREWLWPAGYSALGILKPDIVLFLDVNPKIARVLNRNKKEREYLKGKKKDLAEKNFDHQVSAYKEYLYSVKKFKYWKKIKCVSGNKIDKPEVIQKRIWNVVSKYLN